MKPKFQIGDRFIDTDDGYVGIMVEVQHDPFSLHYPTAAEANRFLIKWPSFFDDGGINIWYYEEELVREVEEKMILRIGNANQIWKDLNNEV